jgi:L-alanine-DL-glutamate epimerase-like enolase superfamily enzyme
MRITDFEIRVVEPPNVGFKMGQQFWVEKRLVLFTIRTDTGHDGVAGTAPAYAAGVVEALKRTIGPMLLERDPFERERVWQDLFSMYKVYLPTHAAAVADAAMRDLAGKILDVPVNKLHGTYRTSLPAYASTPFYADEATYLGGIEGFVQDGFRAVKIHVTGIPSRDIALCRKVRKLVGDDIALMVDAAGHYELTDAMRVGRVLEELDYEWLEMPLDDPYLDAYAQLARDLDIAITSGEVTDQTFNLSECARTRCLGHRAHRHGQFRRHHGCAQGGRAGGGARAPVRTALVGLRSDPARSPASDVRGQ